LKTGKTDALRDALGLQKKEEGNNWMSKIKQELESLGMGIFGRMMTKVWLRIRKMYVYMEMQNWRLC
jgi:hypothetical protein